MSVENVSRKVVSGTINQLAQGKSARVTSLGAGLPADFQKRLTELRFLNGDSIRMVQRNGDHSFIVKIDNDSPFAIDDRLASNIFVKMNAEDVFVKQEKPLRNGIKSLINKIFSK